MRGNSQTTTAAVTQENKVQTVKKSLEERQHQADIEKLVLEKVQRHPVNNPHCRARPGRKTSEHIGRCSSECERCWEIKRVAKLKL